MDSVLKYINNPEDEEMLDNDKKSIQENFN